MFSDTFEVIIPSMIVDSWGKIALNHDETTNMTTISFC